MIFLGNNVLVEHDLSFEDIKPRLLGMHFPNVFGWNSLIIFRPLGNVSGLDPDICPSQPSHPKA